jgi:acyl-CoA synthetase (AMP-forming)/AMP-acid ligase II
MQVKEEHPMALESYNTLGGMIELHAQAYHDKVALEFEGCKLTYLDINHQANKVANAITQSGIKHGDHVSYLGKNSIFYFCLLLGCSKIGVIVTPINWRLASPEISYILNDCSAKALFVGREYTGIVSDLKPELKTCEAYISYESDVEGFSNLAKWLQGQDTENPKVIIDYEDVFVQLYTSGTTGHPKGVMITHKNIVQTKQLIEAMNIDWYSWTETDVSLNGMPFFHIGGTAWGLSGLMAGARSIITREFVPSEVLGYIQISKIFLVPAAMQMVVNHPRAREVNYDSIRYMLYGASPIPLDLLRTCMDVFGCGFVQLYGMTETSGTIVALPPEDHDPNGNKRMRSAGRALPGVEVGIMNEDGKLLPPGQIGQIVTRSSANMKGYWNLDAASRETLINDGWLCTGDAGEIDSDGYVYILDRVKDMIISGGENVYPAEVENALFSHADVADAGVIGVPDAKWGEAVKACIVLKENSVVSESEIIAFAKTQIAGYKCPKSIDFVTALPRNPSGKILRRELRKPYWDKNQRAVN